VEITDVPLTPRTGELPVCNSKSRRGRVVPLTRSVRSALRRGRTYKEQTSVNLGRGQQTVVAVAHRPAVVSRADLQARQRGAGGRAVDENAYGHKQPFSKATARSQMPSSLLMAPSYDAGSGDTPRRGVTESGDTACWRRGSLQARRG